MEQAVKLKKKDFLKQVATPATKRHAKAALVMTFLCIGLLLFSLYLSCVTPVEELPVVDAILDLGGHGLVSDLKNELIGTATSFDMILRNPDDSITPDVQAYFTEFSRLARELADTLSLQNMQKLMAHYANVPDSMTSYLSADDLAVASLLTTIVNGIILGVAIALGFPMLLTVLGGFCRSTALAVIGMIFSIAITLALFMTPLFLLYQLLQILLIVFTSKVNKAYKIYKRTPIAAPVEPAEPAAVAE